MKNIYLTLFSAAILAFSSCSDFLEQDVRGEQNLDTYFTNEKEAESFINGCYYQITFNDYWMTERFYLLADMCTDDYWMGNTSQSQSEYISVAHYQGQGQSNETLECFWQYRYKGILSCNIAIDKIAKAPILDEKKKQRLIGEAKFLRGFFYSELVKNFGGVPIMKEFVMPNQVEGITRNTQDEVYQFIEKDLLEAAEVLPQKSEYADADMGRATRGAALGLLGKCYMYNGQIDKAKKILKEVIDEGEYALMDDFGKVWNVNFENNDESLFEIQQLSGTLYWLGSSLTIVSGNRTGGDQDGWAWGLPTANLENAFIEAGDTERLRWTIIKNGCTEIAGEDNFDKLVELQGNVNGDGTYCVIPSKHKSARINRKVFMPLNTRPENFDYCAIPLNYIILRYADILLLYAEACNETGDDAEALKYLNMVHERALLEPYVGLTGTELRDAIRKERRLELACEAQRLYDIRRWDDDNGKKAICNILGPDGSFVKWNTDKSTADPYEWDNQYEPSNKGYLFDETRDLLFPIPLYEINMSNGSIKQNPGW